MFINFLLQLQKIGICKATKAENETKTDCNTENMYKDTYQSFINLLVKCQLRVSPICERKCELFPSMETRTTSETNKLDEEYDHKLHTIVSNTETKIEEIQENEPYICASDIIDEFKKNTELRDCYKEYCTFKQLWLSTLSGLKDCDTHCIVKDMDVVDTKFLIRKMQDLVVNIEGVKKEKTCFHSKKICIDAVKDIISDEFTSNDYNKQINQLKIAANGMIGELDEKYSDWAQNNQNNKDCVGEIEKCLGKP